MYKLIVKRVLYFSKLITPQLTKDVGQIFNVFSLIFSDMFLIESTMTKTTVSNAAKLPSAMMRYLVTGGPEEDSNWKRMM